MLRICILSCFSLIILAGFTGCKKDINYTTKAVINGYDYRMCACCGGLMISLNDNPNPAISYDISNSAESLGINSSTTFPVYMKVNYRFDTVTCGPPRVLLLSYQRL
jgi:hypothetical protein